MSFGNLSGLLSGMDGLGLSKGAADAVAILGAAVAPINAIGGQVAQNLDISQRPELTRILTQSQVNVLNAQGWNEQTLQRIATQSQLDLLKAQGVINQSLVSTAPAGAGLGVKGAGGGGGAAGSFGGESLWSNPWTWAAIGGAVLLIGGGVAYKRSRS